MLAIEHDWRLRKLIRANLEAMGLEVQEAVSGQHGLQLLREGMLRERSPDLILLDLDLPGVDVTRLLRALHDRLDGRPVPIIVISAEPPAHELLEQGYVASYLRKPFAVPALLDQVRQALDDQVEHR